MPRLMWPIPALLAWALAWLVYRGLLMAGLPALLAAVAPVERLVLIGPATRNFDVAAVPADTLVVHGEADDVVPLQATLDWARPQHLPVVVVPGAGHFFHGQLSLLKSIVVGAWRR